MMQRLRYSSGRDPQVERALEGVVVGRERPRVAAAVERLQDRRLDLDEAVVVERAAHRGDDPRARLEQGAHLGARDQVELTAAEARLDVGQPVVLVGRRAQRLGQHGEGGHPQRELAAARADRDAVDPDQVAEVEPDEQREAVLAQLVDARHQLDPARAVDKVEERRPPRLAPRRQAPRDAVGHVGLLFRRELRMRGQHRGDRLDARERVRERIDPRRAQPLELRPPRGEQLGHVLVDVAHRERVTSRRRRSW